MLTFRSKPVIGVLFYSTYGHVGELANPRGPSEILMESIGPDRLRTVLEGLRTPLRPL